MTLLLDGRYVHRGDRQPHRLKYWERRELTLQPLRDTPLGELEVGQPWVCSQWLFEKVYVMKKTDDLHAALDALNYSERGHEPWRNQVGNELNELIGRAVYCIETCGDETDVAFAKAVLSICKRVSEFESIQSISREQLIAQQLTKK